ncbi:hypothetical protein [Pedobacter sp.]|uniref:hypothetical protein n=1 Tax=Pedobacter sp. TaxID=1411316 RepID=UPI003D7FFDC3
MENQDTGKLKNQDDVNPSSQFDKIVGQQEDESLPVTNGTGANNPVPTSGTLIIKSDDEQPEKSEDQQEKKG